MISVRTIFIKALVVLAAAGLSAWAGMQAAHRAVYASETGNAIIHNGVWSTSRFVGSKNADAYTRALVAATGLLALPREETVYFRARQDDEGRPISSVYDYIIEGKPPPARWWSLTLYDGDHFLNRDATGPYSVKSTSIETAPDGSFRVILSWRPHEGNWIDMGTGENMSLSIRAYNPDPSFVENLATAPMFSIRRVSETRSAAGELRFAVAADEARIAYYDSGPKDGRAVVLLASLGRPVSDFNELAAALNDAGFRTIAVEMRGVGRSAPVPAEEMTLNDLGDDIGAALAHAGVAPDSRVDVIGHAFGNRLARAVASARPERVRSIVLIAAGGAQNLAETPDALDALKKSFDDALPLEERGAAIRYAFFAGDNPIPDYWMSGWHAEAAQFQSAAVRRTPEHEWREAGGIAPMLVIQAKEDRIAPAVKTSNLLKEQMPARVTVLAVDGAGHALLPEQPAAIASAVVDFLNSPE